MEKVSPGKQFHVLELQGALYEFSITSTKTQRLARGLNDLQVCGREQDSTCLLLVDRCTRSVNGLDQFLRSRTDLLQIAFA